MISFIFSSKCSTSLFCLSSSISSLMAWISALVYSGDSSSVMTSGILSISASFEYPNPLYCSSSLSELPSSENLSLILMNLETIDLSSPNSPFAKSR